jgi:hypothetical protein
MHDFFIDLCKLLNFFFFRETKLDLRMTQQIRAHSSVTLQLTAITHAMASLAIAVLTAVATASGYGPGRTMGLHKHVTLQATRSRLVGFLAS